MKLGSLVHRTQQLRLPGVGLWAVVALALLMVACGSDPRDEAARELARAKDLFEQRNFEGAGETYTLAMRLDP